MTIRFWRIKWRTAWVYLLSRWKYLWMSKAERQRWRAYQKILNNTLAQAPLDKIMAGESCSWDITDEQAAGAMAGVRRMSMRLT